VEGEAGVADAAVGERGIEELECAQIEHLAPEAAVQPVEQIAV